MTRLQPAALAWYATGRFYRADDGHLADYGYFLHLPGLDGALHGGELFDGQSGETTAHFTFAATPFKAGGLDNGALSLALDPVGEFSLYFQRQPAGDFDVPDSFAEGERIATFRRTSLVVGTTVETGTGASAQLLFGNNVFTAHMIESRPFEFGGRRHDLAQSLGQGVPSSALRRLRRSCRRRTVTPWWCRSRDQPSHWAKRYRKACTGVSYQQRGLQRRGAVPAFASTQCAQFDQHRCADDACIQLFDERTRGFQRAAGGQHIVDQ